MGEQEDNKTISLSTFNGGRSVPTIYGDKLENSDIFIEISYDTARFALQPKNIQTFVNDIKRAISDGKSLSIGQGVVFYASESAVVLDEQFEDRIVGSICPNCGNEHESHMSILIVGDVAFHKDCAIEFVKQIEQIFEDNSNDILAGEFKNNSE